jgi:hypothetical protein
MKYALLIPLAAILAVANSHAQSRIYRCGNTYTNNTAEAQAKGCRLMEGGNITVVEGTKVSNVKLASMTQSAGAAPQRIDSGEQRARDSDARLILESELKKAEAKRADLVKEYNNGEPEMLGPEHRNHQKYLDRTAELKASIARNESDIAGIKRELDRLTASK